MFVRLNYVPKEVYHYTKIKNLEQIQKDKKIKKFKDQWTFFAPTIENAKYLLTNVVCNPKCATYNYEGIAVSNTNKLEDFCILKLVVDTNYTDSSKWFSPNVAKCKNEEILNVMAENIAYKGDLRFKNCVMISLDEI